MTDSKKATQPLHVRLGENTTKMLDEVTALLEETRTALITRLIREEYDRQSHRFAMRAIEGAAGQGIPVDPSRFMTSRGPLVVDTPPPTFEPSIDADASQFFEARP